MNKDIFDILGINGREDSYTNLLYELFNESDDFKKNLSEYFFNDSNIENLRMMIRTSYNVPNGLSKKIVPDILIYNTINFAIIEVKIFAGEGWKQLERYNDNIAKEMIAKCINEKEHISLDPLKAKVYFLTFDGTKDEKEIAEPIKWKKIKELIPETSNINNPQLKLCVGDFKKRIDEYYNNATNINDDNIFEQVFSVGHFVGNDRIIKEMFDNNNFNNCSIWQEWNAAQNRYATSLQIYVNDNWKSKKEIVFDDDNDIVTNKSVLSAKNNYDIHYEFQFYWDNDLSKWRITFRIDYHTNPYLSEKDIKYYDLIYLFEQRKKIIYKLKEQLKEYNENLYSNMPAQVKGKLLSVYREDNKVIENRETVKDVKDYVYGCIEKTEFIINELLKIINNSNL